MTRRLRLGAVLASGLLALLIATGTALAQEANQVTGVAVEQADGFASLSWDSVEGATDYQIERTPVKADDVPTGPPAIVGFWRANRTVTPDSPTFADAGFNPGDRFRWRVRARTGTTEHPFSDPVFGTTLPQWGDPDEPGENLVPSGNRPRRFSTRPTRTNTPTPLRSTRPVTAYVSWRSAARS